MAAKQEGEAAQFNPYENSSASQGPELITRQLKVAERVRAIIAEEIPIPTSVGLTMKGLPKILFSVYEDLVDLGMKPEEAFEATKLPKKEESQPQP